MVVNGTTKVLVPESEEYEICMSRIFHGGAAGTHPFAIIQPSHESDIVFAIDFAKSNKKKLFVLGGGHSGDCSANDCVLVDLSSHMGSVRWIENDGIVLAQGGATVGRILGTLAEKNKTLPVGVYGTPGMGLVLQGGIGYLTRSLGLTIDRIKYIRGIRISDGESFEASGDTERMSLPWRLLRGAAPFLAIITEVALMPASRTDLHVMRTCHQISALRNVIPAAECLPKACSCSLVIGRLNCNTAPVALSYAVGSNTDLEVQKSLSRLENIWVNDGEIVSGPWHTIAEGLAECPPYEMPDETGSVPSQHAESTDRGSRPDTWIMSLLYPSGLADTPVVDAIEHAIENLPNANCNIALQHMGGVVAEVGTTATAFAGRTAEWSAVITSVWDRNDTEMGKRCKRWAQQCFTSTEKYACGCYIVERHPNTDFFERELNLAFGENLSDMKALKRSWDPDNILQPLDNMHSNP